MSGQINIVSTPIGNLKDITLRAIETLKSVDLILAEDTRIAKKLLNHFSINNTLESFNDKNEDLKNENLIKDLKEGKNIAIISDAGTPLISDPGFKLIRSAREENIKVTPIPGCTALIAGLSASGISSDKFTFLGFLPRTKIKRRKNLRQLVHKQETLIFFESVHRIGSTIADMKELFGQERKAVLCKEITKIYESFIGNNFMEITDYIKEHQDKLKGEFTIIVEGNRELSIDLQKIDKILDILQSQISSKDAIKICSIITGYKKSTIYKRLLERKQ
ncbi:MAG: ribosomal RNA small subunit methyltransferase I [Gammaproteobacteria bacterium]|nr:MAG: ribosomal RNA small subunit methyltransferase I [Gammaproteobacteria bacterium]